MSNFTLEVVARCSRFLGNQVFQAELRKYVNERCKGRVVRDMHAAELVGLMNEIIIPWENGSKVLVELCYRNGLMESYFFAKCLLVDGKPDLSTMTIL